MNFKNYIIKISQNEALPAISVLVMGHLFVLWSFLSIYSYAQFKWINWDVGNIFLVAKKFSGGQNLFSNHFDNQFPSTIQTGQFFLNTSNFLNLDPAIVYHSFVVLLSFASGLYLLRLFRGRDPVFLIFLSLLTHSILFMPTSRLVLSFGQREHLLAIVFLPYLLDAFMNKSAGFVKYSFLLLTCWFASSKPQYSFLVVGVEVLSSVLWRQIKFAALAAALLVPFLPFLILYFQSPESFWAFFTDLLPYYLSGAYKSFAAKSLLRFYDKVDWLLIPLCFSLIAHRQAKREQKKRIVFLLLMSLLSLAIALQLRALFHYHFMIFYACLCAMICYSFSIIFIRKNIDSIVIGILSIIVAVNIFLNINHMTTSMREFNRALSNDAELEIARNQDVAIIAGHVVMSSTIEYHWNLNNILPWIFYLPIDYQYAFRFDSFRKNLGDYAKQVDQHIHLKKPKFIIITLANYGYEKGYVMEALINYELLSSLNNYSLVPAPISQTNEYYRIYSRKESESKK